MVEQIELNGFYFFDNILYQVTGIYSNNTCALTNIHKNKKADQNYSINYFKNKEWRKALIHEIPAEHRKNILETLELW